MVLRKLYLPISLRGDEKNIGGHQEKEMYLGTAREEKIVYLPQYDSFMGMRGGIGGLLEMLLLLFFMGCLVPHKMENIN
jgi:hypothetical protein